jgi:threonine/homoserine/homoserine lactone efflux protein
MRIADLLGLAIRSVVIEFFVLLGYGALAGHATPVAARPRFVTLTNRIAGCLLITAGVRAAAIRRT